MYVTTIEVAANGFVLRYNDGSIRIANSLMDAAKEAGESVPESGSTNYAPGFSADTLNRVRYLFKDNQKINAIKLLRDAFAPRLGLREAKDLVEQLCY